MTVSTPGPRRLLESVTGSTLAAVRALSAWVPIPKVTVPVRPGRPARGTEGSVTITPLLSVGNAATGLGSCSNGATALAARPMIDAQPLVGQS